MINTAVVIPCLNPDDRMVDYVRALSDQGFAKIIVVNDGSAEEFDSFFARAESFRGCVVLRHVENRGKGCALKTAMKYYLDSVTDCNGIITADADGQHTLEDAVNISRLMTSMDDALILGSRDFSQDDVPARSRFGNRCTSVVFKLAHGSYLRDTQTGLRGIPNKLIPVFADLRGERYEYEMNMLIECSRRNIKMVEEPIKTVYIDDNSSSHFKVFRDSGKIYWIILRDLFMYILSGVISFVVDQGLYILMFYLLLPRLFGASPEDNSLLWIAIAAGVARVCSSLLNYFLNKRLAFRNTDKGTNSLLKYALLVVLVLATSSLLVWILTSITPIPKIVIKPIVDLVLVFINYSIQRTWVFKPASES